MSPITWIAAHVRGSDLLVVGIHVARTAAWRAYRADGGLGSRRQFMAALEARYPWQVVEVLPP